MNNTDFDKWFYETLKKYYPHDGAFMNIGGFKAALAALVARREALMRQGFYGRFKQEFIADESVTYTGDLLAVVRRAAGITDSDIDAPTTEATQGEEEEQ